MKFFIILVAALFSYSVSAQFTQAPKPENVVNAEKKFEEKKVETKAAKNVEVKAGNVVDAEKNVENKKADVKEATADVKKAKKESIKAKRIVKQAKKEEKQAEKDALNPTEKSN
jgi:TPP-dependent 2-oxoacid decarboxylase